MEIDDKILKFEGFDSLDDFIKKQPKGKEWTLYFVQAWTKQYKK